MSIDRQKKDILTTINRETKAAFDRDYESWQDQWVHHRDITKTYLDFADSSFSESLGWREISTFVKDFMEANPDPEPVPQLVTDIDVRLYEDGAFVTFEQMDAIRGRKRESRLMEKVDGRWRIAGMHTSIYGFDEQE